MTSNINQRVLNALKEAKEKLAAVEEQKNESIAIIGMAGRFPGANNLDEYWHNLQQGVNSIRFLSDEELQASGVSQDLINNPNYVRAHSSFDGIEDFDAEFFGYSPLEAEIIDPQHRIFLESAWTALENAGYDSDRFAGKIGVFAGSALNTYLLNLNSSPELQKKLNNVQVVISNVMGLMPTRVSYKLNLKGASCGIQTGCSTSLVAVHLACRSLLDGESDMALAGGITVNTEGKQGYLYQEGSIASPDGYCRAFDAEGKGTIFGNGVGIVVLKRLSAAIKDRDNIYAIIKGSAINNDGGDKVGLTAPSVTGQAEVINCALQQAKVEPETISYIEAHGTGTSLGDPIELAALNKVFPNRSSKCAIGSVKSNLGHLDAAAGISGLIKTVLALHHQQIPPSLNFQSPNPEINFANFYVNTKLTEWEANGYPLRAGVSSFGMGGTNAHVVLEGAESRRQKADGAEGSREEGLRPSLLVISAKTETALSTATDNLVSYLQKNPDVDLADVAYTLQIGRKAFNYRRMVIATTVEEAIEKLTTSPNTKHQQFIDRPITFMFSGQGSQYIDMGRELYETQPVFKENCDRCFQILDKYLDVSLKDIVFSEGSPKGLASASGQRAALKDIVPLWYTPSDKGRSKETFTPFPLTLSQSTSSNSHTITINETQYAQPAIFTIEYALAKLWMSWGIMPSNAIGHSIGEYVAATLAGVFGLEDALRIVAKRGELMQQCPTGAMLSVAMSANDAVNAIADSKELSLAVVNAPELCVISGTENAIAGLENDLPQQGIACRRLHTSHAFHSAMMEEILDKFIDEFNVEANCYSPLNNPQLPFVSNVTGTWITDEEATSLEYWAKHIRQTVNFSGGIKELLTTPNQILLEVGGGRTLATLAKQHQSPEDTVFLTSLPHPKEKLGDISFILNTLGQLWLSGVEIDWKSLHQNETPYRIPLPTYPFERQRYWIDRVNNIPATNTTPVATSQPVKKPDLKDWIYIPSWQRDRPLSNNHLELKEDYTCLIFARYNTFSQELKAKLKKLGCQVISVSPATAFSQENDKSYKIDPLNPQDYLTLLDKLETNSKLPQKIIYLWSLKESAIFTDNSQQDFNNLIHLTQALTSKKINKPIQLSIITSNIQEVTGNEQLNPNLALVMGICKVIPQEFPQLICHNIDLEINSLGKSNIVDNLVTGVLTIPTENVTAYRRNFKWRQVITELPVSTNNSLPLKPEGTYVIAGDLVEGLGMMYARSLATEYKANLVLIGREGLPKQSNWQVWLEDNQSHWGYKLIQQLQELATSGTEIIFISSSLTDRTTIQSLVNKAIKKFENIDGVIHADTMGDNYACPLKSLTAEEISKQFQNKVKGLTIFDEILTEAKPDWFLLQSSLSSIVGGIGFTTYTAANIFMDTFATTKNTEGNIPWFTINWDGYKQEQTAKIGLNLIDLAINPDEAWEITKRVLSNNITQAIASPTDLQPRIDKWIKPKSLTEIDKLQAQTSLTALSKQKKPNVSAEYVAPKNNIEEVVITVMEELLGIDKIGADDNFFELGGHSLLAIQIVSRLKQEFQVDIPMREFLFESPTAAKIAGVISNNLIETNDTDEMEKLLTEVENMSEDEIQAMLNDA
ncbi:MAG: beta-ketoacyl synthase N-terminal-like domain-containing protein [Cyanobacteria bacterium P01_G01_bin.19]